jgi:hypothetical protein
MKKKQSGWKKESPKASDYLIENGVSEKLADPLGNDGG